MNNERFIKTINIIDVILKIAQILCGVLIALIVVVGIYFKATGISSIDSTLDFGELELTLADFAKYVDTDLMINSILILMVGGIVIVGIAMYMMRVFRHIINPMKQGRPFEMSVVKELKHLAAVVLVGGFFGEGLLLLVNWMQYNAVDFVGLVEGSQITGIMVNHTMDFNFIIYAGIIYLLSHIFQYGVMLQTESDETL